MYKRQNGRSIVAAAGNGGDHQWHLSYEVTEETNYTWFQYHPDREAAVWQLWADTVDFNGVNFSIGADNAGFVFETETPFYNIKNDFTLTATNIDSVKYILANSNGTLGEVTVYAQKVNHLYLLQF